jgi:uncharacterized membrane protein
MKESAEIITKHLSSTVEVMAAIVIGIALLKFLYKYTHHLLNPNDGVTNQTIRIHFGSSLTVALELLLAAAIAVLPTALNFFWKENQRIIKLRGQKEEGLMVHLTLYND